MKNYSWFSVLVVVLLSACGTFEVSVEQPTPTPTAAALKFDDLQGREQSTTGDIPQGSLFVGEEAAGLSKIVIVSGDLNWIAVIDNGQMIVLVHQPESHTALVAVDRNDKIPQDLKYPADSHHDQDTNPNALMTIQNPIQSAPDSRLHQQSIKTHPDGVVSVQPLDGLPTLSFTNTASVLFLNSSNGVPLLIDFSDRLNTSLIATD